jgi:hypothetical protein
VAGFVAVAGFVLLCFYEKIYRSKVQRVFLLLVVIQTFFSGCITSVQPPVFGWIGPQPVEGKMKTEATA